MQGSLDPRQAANDTLALSSPGGDDRGWYLYGIVRGVGSDHEGIRLDGALPANGEEQPLETIASGELVALVRRVPIDDFSTETLRARAEDPAWIEDVARRHNAVIEAVHRTRTVLPAKFGAVYVRAEDVRTALEEEHETLLERLNWLDGCDEWGVHLYGDVATIRQRAETEQESVRRLREDLATASPGRAYFLQRKLEEALASSVDSLLDDLNAQAYEAFARHAKAGQVSRRSAGEYVNPSLNPDEERMDVFAASFLVSREATNAFIEDISEFVEGQPGLWCEYTGPWPPYSFAAKLEQTAEG